ncbi:FAD-dependent monooxygenase [Mycobacterium sp. AZCC_0083]|uniref:FAD-dependent monooxygenase n=1 Tax=Mycobacterium sp. AZCC_0083 TaxID=2735882 RepID=UPI00161A6A3A|nr:FAD-dependent monooxygenase [Mycobacterium sp. AZCC_0083]MBB5160497.1 2-polyprenyl-6-methoxyphenol hydroxylase-like FAD-dependent oxidoreductase [Mycobacterium sp. AZCC_0083]
MTDTPTTLEAVVVGAGPVGLVAACELARRGIRVRVIDKLAEPTTESRAIAIHSRSLDMFDRMGIVDDLVATGAKSMGMKMFSNGRELFHVEFDGVDSAFPWSLLTPQTETERVLFERLTSLGVYVERGTELTDLTQGDNVVQLTVRHSDGATETIATPWVIGADGSHSTVRHLVGARLAGSFKGERFILGDCDADSDLAPDSMHTMFAPEGPVLFMPMRDGRARIMAEIHDAPGTPLNLQPAQDDLQRILDQRVGGITITKSHWLTCFEVHHGQVPAYRYGRVFLVGDAAHIHSPAGGQGMNTGMQDAFNLVWKLAATISGDGGQALLDSYHVERYPVAERVISFSSKLTTAATLHGGAHVVRNAIMKVLGSIPAVGDKLAALVEEIGIGYQGSPAVLDRRPRHADVVAGQHLPHPDDPELRKELGRVCSAGHTVLTVAAPDGPTPAAGPAGHVQVLITSDGAPVDGHDETIVDPGGAIAKRYGLRSGGRVVVRPDGYIGAVTALDDPAGIADYFDLIAR